MARIRTIKPEFPQSESMGRISRDARLAFIMLWTLSDDEGRLRGSSRMLASILFPYDEDAPQAMPGWLGELEVEGCIIQYQVDQDSYIQICKWLHHQKIDKPSKSKIPPFDESSRIIANPRVGIKDQGSRIKGSKDQGSIEAPSGASCPEPVKPSPGSPALYEVACVGTGAKKWPLTQEKLDEWVQAFPGVDVKLELRKAIQWLKDNPSKAKTYRGLPAFFGRWLSTAQDKPKNGAPKIHAPSHRASADQSLLDQLANQEKEAPSATKYNAIEEFLAQM